MAEKSKLSFDEAVEELNKREDLSEQQKDAIYSKMEAERDNAESSDAVDWRYFLSSNAPTIDERIQADLNRDKKIEDMFSLSNIKKNPAMLYTKGDSYWRKWDEPTMADAAIRYGYLPSDLRWPTGNPEHDAIREQQLKQFHDDAIKYEASMNQQAAEYETRKKRQEYAEDLEKNKFDLFSPIESLKRLISSNDKIGFLQNSINSTLFPSAYRLAQEALNGNSNVTDNDIIRAAFVDGGINVATAPLGGSIASVNPLKYGGMRTKLGELVGDAAAGAVAGGVQEFAAEDMLGNGYSPGDIAMATLFGAGGNAATKGVSLLGSGAIGAYTGIKGGKSATRLKGATDFLNDAAYTSEAVEGSRIKDMEKGSKGGSFANTRSELQSEVGKRRDRVEGLDVFGKTLGDDPKAILGDKLKKEYVQRTSDLYAQKKELSELGMEGTEAWEDLMNTFDEHHAYYDKMMKDIESLPSKEQWSRMSPEERRISISSNSGIGKVMEEYGEFYVPDSYNPSKLNTLSEKGNIAAMQPNLDFTSLGNAIEAGKDRGGSTFSNEPYLAKQVASGKSVTDIFGGTENIKQDPYAVTDLFIEEFRPLENLVEFGAEKEAEKLNAMKTANMLQMLGLPKMTMELAKPNPAPIINMVTGIVQRSNNDRALPDNLKETRFQNGNPLPEEAEEYQRWKEQQWKNGVKPTLQEQHSPEYQRWWINNQLGIQ